MALYLLETVNGIFLFDESLDIKEKIILGRTPQQIAKKLFLARKKVIPEEKRILEKFKSEKIYVEFPEWKIRELGGNLIGKSTEIHKNAREKFVEAKLLKEVCKEISKLEIKENISKKELLVINLIGLIDELDETINSLMGKFKEVAFLYSPEILKLESNEDILHFIVEGKSAEIKGDFSKKDVEQMRNFAIAIKNLYEWRDNLTNRVKEIMQEIAPNLSAVAGELIGARLISAARSLENLAKMPSSKIQILGAYKAIFRHLTKGTKPPKYGILYRSPLINRAPKKVRGKIARILASKIALAARIDFFRGENRSQQLKEELKERIEKICSHT